ncbi:MAG TPA: XdhC family protein [Steroidobacteraceae bacterium]
MKSSDLFELSRELRQQRQPHAWITVTSVTSPSSSYVGAQAIVTADGQMSGWIGGGCVQSAARAAALSSLSAATPRKLRLSNIKDPSEAIDVRPMACASNGAVELFIQPVAVAPCLRIYGSTPIVATAAWFARQVDFDPLTDQEAADVEALNALASTGPVPNLTERETYALIATQGEGDETALELALRSCARAVLVVASKRKAERLRATMELRGISKERLDAMHAPAGPDIGSVTPDEIALAAVAGIVALRRRHRMRRAAQPLTGYINPVCGAVVDPAHAQSTITLGGQTHYFCCQACRTEFERDPQKYLEIGAHMREPVGMTRE